MSCDICNTPCATYIVQPSAMSRAVKKGFNPFSLGMIPENIARLAAPDYPAKWSRLAATGILSQSAWVLCDACRPKLEPFLKHSPWWRFGR